jgi:hypothetical protein
MATWVGHGIAGVAVARAMGMGPRATAAAFVLASTPDLDLALGLALEGDAAAYHRAWWAHSPAVAGAGAAVAFAGALAWQRLGGRGGDTREAGRWALLAGLVLLTHTLADFVVINPLRALPYPDFQLDDASDRARCAAPGAPRAPSRCARRGRRLAVGAGVAHGGEQLELHGVGRHQAAVGVHERVALGLEPQPLRVADHV